MRISVIIPVYNAEPFISKAVNSALEQPETKEVLLVEDGSEDNSLKTCQKLTEKYAKVKLFAHPKNQNLGAGASRNLGVKKASCDYIAFLDADDFYCPNRFEKERTAFKNSKTEGIYGGIGYYAYSKKAKQSFKKLNLHDAKGLKTVNNVIPWDELPYKQLGKPKRRKQGGYFSIISLTVRKSVFEKAGLFNPKLKVHQDTDWKIRLALTCRIETGAYKKAVAMRGVHENNRITKVKNQDVTKCLMYSELLEWAINNNIDQRFITMMEQRKEVYKFRKKNNYPLDESQIRRYLQKHPKLIFNRGAFNLLLKDFKKAANQMSYTFNVLEFISRVQAFLKRIGYALLHKIPNKVE